MPERLSINKDTIFCMSLSARPGNFGTRFQNFLYERLGLNFVYKAFTTTDIRGAIAGVRALSVRGCAISMPYKEACIELLDGLDASASAIQAVNTIVNDGGRLTGYNTDYSAVRQLLGRVPAGSSFALQGSGGMAKAVAAALRDSGFLKGVIVARNEWAGRKLAEHCGFQWASRYDGGASLLVNASPLGMKGPEAALSAFSPEAVAMASTVFDVVAIPVDTPLIRSARAAGRAVITGDEVLVLQALEQFTLYTGVHPSSSLVAEAAAFALG
jgi:shikimate dehydrogenase